MDPGKELTPAEQNIVDLSAKIHAETPDDIAYQQVVLCHLGFPRSKTSDRIFERKSGDAHLRLEAGALYDGNGYVQQPLPYGVVPRVILIAAITEAKKNRSPVVPLGKSMSESLRKLGLADSGEEHWRRVGVQARALAALHMRLGWRIGNQVKTFSAPPINEFTAWAHRDPRQLTLSPSEIIFSLDFYSTLEKSSVPLDPRGVTLCQGYPYALDVYCWLAHRLYRVRNPKGDRVPWAALQPQFGGTKKHFKMHFIDALNRALMAYPQARVRPSRDGLILLASPPPVAKKGHRVVLPWKTA